MFNEKSSSYINDLKKKINSRTKAIITVGMWGYCGYNRELETFAKLKKIPIIEDSAQSLGAINNCDYEGCRGLIGCFSTHELKLISTGEGGFVLTNNLKIYKKIKSFSKVGFVDNKGYGEELGLNLKNNAITASLGINQLKKIDTKIQKRQQNILLWKKLLSLNHNLVSLDNFYTKEFKESGYSVCFFNNNINFNSKIFAEKLHNLGVSTDIYRYNYQILPKYKIFKEFKNGKFLNAEKLISKLIVLPTHEILKRENIEKAAKIILNLLN